MNQKIVLVILFFSLPTNFFNLKKKLKNILIESGIRNTQKIQESTIRRQIIRIRRIASPNITYYSVLISSKL